MQIHQLFRLVMTLSVVFMPVVGPVMGPVARDGSADAQDSAGARKPAAGEGQAEAPEKAAFSDQRPAVVAGDGDRREAEPQRRLYRGRVVLAQEALKERGIQVAEEMKNQAVLETPDGQLIPIAADWRGRAFFQDKRLRKRPVELVGYRRPGIPWLQVLIIYVINDDGQREVMDYWCDICAIPMYEIKDCECCQGPIRLRLQPAKLPDYLKPENEPADKTR